MKKFKRVLSLLVCVAMLASLVWVPAFAAVKIKGDVITNITFDNANSLDDLSADLGYIAFSGARSGYATGEWPSTIGEFNASNANFALESDGNNKYLKTTSSNSKGHSVISRFTETIPASNDEVYAIEYDIKLNYSENGEVIFDIYSDAIRPTSYFKMGVTDEKTGYVELRYGENNEKGIGMYTQEERIPFPLGEFVNFRLELKNEKWLSGANRTTWNNYRLFINDAMVSDFKYLQLNNSHMALTKFQAAGFRSNAAGTSYAIDNIKFYQLEELTAPSLSKINVTAAGELEQYMDSASEITFTAAGNIAIEDPENIVWYVNDVLQGNTGATFTYTPDAVIGNYEIYAKYGELSSGKITVVMNEPETLNEITITSDGNLAQKGELSQVSFTVAGNIEIPIPENITWYVNGVLQNSTGENFAYTPSAGGSFEIKACYEEMESNTVIINVIHYIADPTEPEFTETTTVFEASDGMVGNSSGDPKRFNVSTGTTDTVTVDDNKVILKTNGVLGKSYIYPVKDVLHSIDMCLLAPEEGASAPDGFILYGSNGAEANKFMKYAYDATNKNYILYINGNKVATVDAGKWFKANIYLYASSNADLITAWNNARATVSLTGDLKDLDGNNIKNVKRTFDRAVESFSDDKTSASISFRLYANNGSVYIDNYLVTYPGSFGVKSSEPETYGEGYGMKLDGKYYINFNRSIDFDTINGAVTVKDSEGNVITPAVYGDLLKAETLIIDFASERLSENAKYTIEISDSLKDATGRRLLDGKISFETETDPSDEAYLSKLAFKINDDEQEIPVNGFDKDIHESRTYNILVDNDTAKVTIVAEAANSMSTVVMSPENGIIDLASGSGSAEVTVTSADLSKTVVHTINFEVSSSKLVESVELKPESLTVWADFKGDLTLTSSVLPETAADRSLVWSSSDENVVKVGMTGKLILVGEGSATIRATANDGSGIYGEMSVTVTPAINRAENQKLNLDSTSTPRINIEEYLSLPENVGDAQIAMWYNNATGVFTLTVDDSIVEDYQYFKEYYDKYGVKTTMFVPVKYYSRARYLGYKDHEMWAWADEQEGLTVQSHSYSHDDFNAMGTAEIAADYIRARDVLSQYITQPAEVVAYASGNVGDMTISKEIHIAGRGVGGYPNHGDRVNYMGTNSLSGLSIDPESRVFIGNAIKSIYTKDYYTYGTNYYGGWLSTHYHGISGVSGSANEILAKDKYGEDATPEQLASEEFYGKDSLDYAIRKFIYPAMQEGKVWSATFAEAAKYGQERDTAVLTMKEALVDSYTFAIADQMDDTIFTHPLTVKIKVANNWTDVSATQNGSAVKAELKEIDGAKYVFVDAVPDKGDVVVNGTLAEVKTATVDVLVINGTVMASENGAAAEDWQSVKTKSVPVGTKLNLTAIGNEGATFMYWIDTTTGIVLSYDEEYELNVGTARSITAVFNSADEIYVVFKNVNGKIVKSELLNENTTVPENPYAYGYEFCGWYLDEVKQNNLTQGALVGSLEKTTIFESGFVVCNDIYTVTYNGEAEEYRYNQKAEFNADAEKDGKVFTYWKRDGAIVSYNTAYSFYVNGNTTLEAVYGESTEKGVVLVMANPVVVSGNKIAFFAERDIPEEYTLVETGILLGYESGLNLDNAAVKAVSKSSLNKGQFTIRKANAISGTAYYGVAYAIYADSVGNIYTAYSNEVSKTL